MRAFESRGVGLDWQLVGMNELACGEQVPGAYTSSWVVLINCIPYLI